MEGAMVSSPPPPVDPLAASDHLSGIPWATLPRSKDDEEKGIVNFYSVPDQVKFPIQIPKDDGGSVLRWKYCLNSSGEWMMVFDDLSNLHMLNPLTGKRISLPPLAAFADNIKPLYESKDQPDAITAYRLLFLHPRGIYPAQDAGMAYLSKVVVGRTSPSTYTAMAINEGYKSRLAFTRTGFKKWKQFKESVFSPHEDIAFHNGRFHSLHRDGTVRAFDLRHRQPKITVISMSLEEGSDDCQRYLAWLSAGELLQVIRFYKMAKTEWFGVYKLVGHKWVEVTDLGDYSLFVGDNNTIAVSVSAHHSPLVRGNCIYFTPESHEIERSDMGIFDLADGSITTYLPNESSVTWPLPVWYFPSPSFDRDPGILEEMKREEKITGELGDIKGKRKGNYAEIKKRKGGKRIGEGGRRERRREKKRKRQAYGLERE